MYIPTKCLPTYYDDGNLPWLSAGQGNITWHGYLIWKTLYFDCRYSIMGHGYLTFSVLESDFGEFVWLVLLKIRNLPWLVFGCGNNAGYWNLFWWWNCRIWNRIWKTHLTCYYLILDFCYFSFLPFSSSLSFYFSS